MNIWEGAWTLQITLSMPKFYCNIKSNFNNDIFRTQSNMNDGALCKKGKWFSAVKNVCKKLQLSCFVEI